MRTKQTRFAKRALAAAVHAALAAAIVVPAAARADTEERIALMQPISYVEIGALYVDEDSAKFGEFNGLDKKGGYVNGGFALSGGDGDAGAYRWRLFGGNLGLDTRELQGEAGVQGRWRISGAYNEIVRNYSDTYRTFWDGAGSTTLTLPPGWPAASSRLSVTNSAGGILANWNNIQSPNATASSTGGGPASLIPANLHNVDIGTKRERLNLGGSTMLAPGWEVKVTAQHEDKDGTKLTGVNIGRFSGVSALLPEPINSSIDQFNASLGFADKRMNFNVGYYGSFYRNDTNVWSVENMGQNNVALNNRATLVGAPDNQMHQFNFQGGYSFAPKTRLTMSGAYSRLTQNEGFLDKPAGATWVYPDTSPHAKVIRTDFFARLTSEPVKNLRLNASYRYEDRDNRTPVMEFLTTPDTPGASTLFENEPIDRTVHTATLEGEYGLGRGSALSALYERQQIERSSKAPESPFRADKTYEDTLRLMYRRTLSEALTGRISYAYSKRRVNDYEEGNPRPTSPPAPFPAADPLLGGFEQFFLSDRHRDKIRSQVNWQASDALNLQGTVDYNRDKYTKLEFGLKESKSWVLGLDASIAASDRLAFNLFYTYENMRMQLDSLAIARGLTTTNLVPHVSGGDCAPYTNVANTLPADYFTDPCRLWSESQRDKVHTLGAAARYRGLMAGRLDVAADLTYAKAKTPIGVAGGTYYNNGVPSSATGNVFIPAEGFPDITSELTQLRLTGIYRLDKRSAVRVMYVYGKLKSSDWAYDAYANSVLGVLAVQNYVGPGITSPNYDVNVVGVAYIYSFR